MKKKIALLPVDARPVTRQLPIDLAGIAGWKVMAPEKELLGFLKRPAKTDVLIAWLDQVAAEVDGMILSIDMLLYGGLVPSRMHSLTEKELQKRLVVIKEWKRQYPDLKIMALSSTMRISNNNINEEEKEYWKDYGTAIWGVSYHSHRYEKLQEETDLLRLEELKNEVPADVLDDYQSTREINFAVNQSLLTLLEDNTIDHLVFPQDDTSEYGWNVREQEQLQAAIRERKLTEQALLYPGADEVASTLVTRLIFQLENVSPPSFYPVYSGARGALSPAMYEDRPICESVKGQIAAVGSRSEDEMSRSDVILGVNVPGRKQGDLALGLNLNQVDTNDRNVEEWLRRLQAYMERKPVAMVDVAYANGVDPQLTPMLMANVNWERLYGFAGWNTAGNSIGTVVSQAALMWLADNHTKQTHNALKKQLLHRFLDDYIYQSIVRKEGRLRMSDSTTLEKVMTPLFIEKATAFLHDYANEWQVEGINYPWDRTFEIDFELRKGEPE
ncbi:DUF4127 family protein [Halobacillus locisalis]|uniref:DUF4127 family protein n=1 Tax=Halobacillus locisalis TaxID=220753 RepID=A0A838CVH9_9BACI|nr:DUF4127 family protein [Halobacillus locisalis]MBA2175923.1 DUF4127 family protein [Halobacillus locisalis]